YSGQADILVYFFARALQVTHAGSFMAFITSNKYLRAGYGTGLRKNLKDNTTLELLIDFGDLPVFDATAYPCIALIQVGKASTQHRFKVLLEPGAESLESLRQTVTSQSFSLYQETLQSDAWNL